MKRKRYTTEQIIAILRQTDTGKTAQEICRGNNLSEQTYHRWKDKYAGMGIIELRPLKQLDEENSRLKKLAADILYFLTAQPVISIRSWYRLFFY